MSHYLTAYWEMYLLENGYGLHGLHVCFGWTYPNDAAFISLNYQVLGALLIAFLLVGRGPKVNWRASYSFDENDA